MEDEEEAKETKKLRAKMEETANVLAKAMDKFKFNGQPKQSSNNVRDEGRLPSAKTATITSQGHNGGATITSKGRNGGAGTAETVGAEGGGGGDQGKGRRLTYLCEYNCFE